MKLPEALPDELLFSRLIRFCTLYSVSVPQFLDSIFGDNRASINPILTAGINSISELFSEDKQVLIREQTLAPLFMHFHPHYKSKLKKALLSNDNYSAIRASQLFCVKEHSKLTIKMCPTCTFQDMKLFGVAYWHRAHNIPGLEFCYEHRDQLLHITLPERFKLYVGLPKCSEYVSQKGNGECFSLAKFAFTTLLEQSNGITVFHIKAWKDKLANLGYISKNNRIRRQKLLSDFYTFSNRLEYPNTNLLPASKFDYKYITNLLYGNFSQHIFKYFLFDYWLSNKLEGSSVSINESQPIILNKEYLRGRCLQLLKDGFSISQASKKLGKSRSYVKLVALQAGIYSILTPAISNKVIRLAYKGFHRIEIARRLSISNGSVEMLISSVDGLVQWRKRCRYESKRRRCKWKVLKHLRENPLCTRKDIKQDCYAAFHWLYIHEKSWSESVLPYPSNKYPNPRAK